MPGEAHESITQNDLRELLANANTRDSMGTRREVTEFNEIVGGWCRANPDKQLDLSGLDLSGKLLAGFNLTDPGSQWQERIPTGVQLENTNLTNANLSGATIEYGDFKKATMTGADLRFVKTRYAQFEHADMSDIDAQNAVFIKAYFNDCRLIRADLRGANLCEADFFRADLRGAKLQNANIEGAIFREADLRGATFGSEEQLEYFRNQDGVMLDADPIIDTPEENERRENMRSRLDDKLHPASGWGARVSGPKVGVAKGAI